MVKMKTLKFFSILFLTCFIVSGLTVFCVPSSNAEWYPSYSGEWNLNGEFNDSGFSILNPVQFNYLGNYAYAYAWFNGNEGNGQLILSIVNTDAEDNIRGDYVIDYDVLGGLCLSNVALAYNDFGENSTISIGYYAENTYGTDINFAEFHLKELSVMTHVSYPTYNVFVDSVCWSNPFLEGGKYGFSCILYWEGVANNVGYMTINGCYLGDSHVYSSEPVFLVTNEYSGKIYSFIVYENTYCIVEYTVGGTFNLGPFFSATDELNNIIDRYVTNSQTALGKYSFKALMYIMHDVSVTASNFRFEMPLVLSNGTIKGIEVLVSRNATAIKNVQFYPLYTFSDNSGVYSAWCRDYQLWYSSSMVNHYIYIYEGIGGIRLQDKAYCPALKGGSLNFFVGDRVFCVNSGTELQIYTIGKGAMVPPSFVPQTPFPSTVGDPAFTNWWNSNNINLITIMIPLMVILIPALMFAVFFGGMGLIVGGLLGSVAGTIAGVIPSWAFVLLLVGIVAMLFVGRSRSGNGGVSE